MNETEKKPLQWLEKAKEILAIDRRDTPSEESTKEKTVTVSSLNSLGSFAGLTKKAQPDAQVVAFRDLKALDSKPKAPSR